MSDDTQRPALKHRTPYQTLSKWVEKAGATLARWWEQPIGVFVPLISLLILLFAPQSADMFAGMVGPGSAFGFAIAAAFLAFSSWYWTRAALLAPEKKDDASWIAGHAARWGNSEKSHREWSYEWAPRIAVLFAGMIAATPLIILIFGEPFARIDFSYPLLASALAVLTVVVVGLFVAVRGSSRIQRFLARVRRFLGRGERITAGQGGKKRWLLECTSVIAAAPFGPRTALFFLALSVIGVAVVAFAPEWVDHADAPIAAILALGFLIPLLVLALALIRDIVRILLTAIFFMFQGKKSKWETLWRSSTQRDVRHLTASLGLFILVGFIFTPWFSVGPSSIYEIRTAARLAETLEPTTDQMAPGGLETSSLGQPRPTIREAVVDWHRARLDAGHPPDKKMPAIIVAAAGGASRAALWLLSSMQMLDDETKLAIAPDGAFGRYLFAISGVSGGSLGAITYLQALRHYPRIREVNGEAIVLGVDWEKAHSHLTGFQSSDLLVALISTYFLNDALEPIIRSLPLVARIWDGIPDRGAALELAFERHWADPGRLAIPQEKAKSGLIELWQGGGRGMPHLLLNGTDVGSGRRVITSTIRFTSEDDLFPASDDLLLLLKHDVPASTAVTNSARFPFISPAGRLWTDGRPRRVVDGGYFENYGARTAAELADKVEQISFAMVAEAREAGQLIAPIVPIIVIVSNDTDAFRSADEVLACKSENEDDACRLLEEATVSCIPQPAPSTQEERSEQAERAAIARGPRGGGFGPEGLAPLLGLNATRGAHGQDALHIVRRHYCEVAAHNIETSPRDALQLAATKIESLPRMIHIALPRPQEGESAPLNWVLNENAIRFLREPLKIDFNRNQAAILRATLQALLEGKPASP